MDSQAQTLARGLKILDLLADAGRPLTIAEIAAGLEVHRSIAYRLVRTLETAALVLRDSSGRYLPGPHLATLARSVAPDLQSAAPAVLQSLADELSMTAFLVVLDRTECVTLVTVEPRHVIASIAQRPGSRHSIFVGAPGVAIQSLLTSSERTSMGIAEPEQPEVAIARRDGFALSHGEVIPGVSAVAAPVRGAVRAAVAVLYITAEEGEVVNAVRAAASLLDRSNR
ncbi:helix-turn-helix domain-containing protein [Galbitalea soli]|uniref:Helix-turn-helix domain-containing protein n=1 Tax=Galbitalea soli TaxID=1268042 RepID=A0A7C9PMR6_9MICO|nr:helix-turn-helix domain-containing protein [Galbitalea soli]NYJ29753.1 DNA-binding IclR family transcriptional regulator [Galbitalea soli]